MSSIIWSKKVSLLLSLGILLAFLAPIGRVIATGLAYINIPYNQDFESGLLPAEWQAQTSGQGRVRVMPAYFPGVGIYSVVLDDSSAGGSTSSAAILLPLNLKRESQVTLSFWYRSYNEETASSDGVFISADGSTWKRIFILDPLASEWTYGMIDLDMEALAYGAPFNEHYWLKFQFSGSEPAPEDGYAFDNISLQRPATTSSLQGTVYSLPNGSLPLPGATLKIYSGSILLFTETTDAGGGYGPVWLAPANYRVEITAKYHPFLKQIIAVPGAQTFYQDFILQWPVYLPLCIR